jgi:hypothetical protein
VKDWKNLRIAVEIDGKTYNSNLQNNPEDPYEIAHVIGIAQGVLGRAVLCLLSVSADDYIDSAERLSWDKRKEKDA